MSIQEIAKTFYEENNLHPDGDYSKFGNIQNEKRRLVFINNNESTTGFLKWPDPTFHTSKTAYFQRAKVDLRKGDENDLQDQEIGNSNQEASESKQMRVSRNACFIANTSTTTTTISGEGTSVQNDQGEECGNDSISEDVQKRLQEQLARKQQEVQEIQQKIAKTKKWGDSRRGSQDRFKYNTKPTALRLFPEPINQFQVLDMNPKKRENERLNDTGSNLDPNSPCFYPSQFAFASDTERPYVMKDKGSVLSMQNDNETNQAQNGGDFNAMYPTPHTKGTYAGQGTNNIIMSSKNNATSFESSKMNNHFNAPTYDGFQTSKHSDHDIPTASDNVWSQLPNHNYNATPLSIPPPMGVIGQPFSSQQKTGTDSCADSQDFSLCFPSLSSTNKTFYSSRRENENGGYNFNLQQEASSKVSEDENRLSNIMTTNVFKPGRMRILRKRQDLNNQKLEESQLKSSNTHCSSCKLDFKWPHVISCLHSFCFSCIAKCYDIDQDQIKCPTCFTVTELNGGGLQDLHLDFTRCKSLLVANRVNPFSCMTCSVDTKHASFYCQECMAFICSDCRRVHEENPQMSSHQLHNVKKIKEVNGRYAEVCSEHPNNILEQYCEECQTFACYQCTSFGERHSKHILGDVNKLYPMAVNKINLMNAHMDQIRNEVQKRIQPLTILKQHIETNIRLCKQEIHKYSNSLLAETESCRSKARLVVDKAHEDFNKDIEVAQNIMVQYLTEYSPLINFFRRYLFSANQQDFMSLSSPIRKKISNMNTKFEEIQKHQGIFDTSVSFKADYAGLNEYLQNQYSRIEITENLSDALPSDTTEMGRRIEQEVLAEIERCSRHFSPGTSVDVDLNACSGSSDDSTDPHSEMFNYSRTPISFIHQFGKYGRGDYEFVEPSGVLYLLDGSLAICDTANHRIMVYDDRFNYLRTIGQPPNLPPLRERKETESRNDSARHMSRTSSCLYFPYRIAQCPQTENVVVVERPPSRDIQIFTIFGRFVNCFGSDILQHPRGVAVDENGVIVTVEGRTMKLMLFSQEGQLLHRFFLSVHLEFPNDVAAKDGLIYISDNRGHCVHVFDYNAEPKRTIGNESVTYYPIGVSLTNRNQVVVTDNHNTFNISVFDASSGRYAFGFKSKVRHANCYNVAVHPHRLELAVTSRENQVVIFNFDPLREIEEKEKVNEIIFRNQPL